jgi:hypothetical protein
LRRTVRCLTLETIPRCGAPVGGHVGTSGRLDLGDHLIMASDAKNTAPPAPTQTVKRDHGIRIFTYPKVIFIFPTLIAALICGVGMKLIRAKTEDPLKASATATATANPGGNAQPTEQPTRTEIRHQRFRSPQNLFGLLFLGVFAFNLVIMALDFPRFTVVGIVLMILFGLFFLLWVGAYFEYDLMEWMHAIAARLYAVANAGFYFMIATILIVIFAVIYITRWLDYWEIMPNEILHHHGPLSDLERYPTLNLKFDKEIPDVFEFLFLGAGRLVLHVADERKSIVLDNVLFINRKEEGLKKLMSRLEVRVTTDQEVAEP